MIPHGNAVRRSADLPLLPMISPSLLATRPP
uniref:Uncharacterized protein n=1 Tax=Arundo donax TaxID=35708 RepID=A0A0A8YKI2_ARUDO